MESKGYDKQIEFLMLMPYSYLNIILQTQIIMSLEKKSKTLSEIYPWFLTFRLNLKVVNSNQIVVYVIFWIVYAHLLVHDLWTKLKSYPIDFFPLCSSLEKNCHFSI